ncbi:MAG: hypothetical protein AB1457_14375 [Chloroflexota bacterium]|nr:MAG: hypothetical protein KatS3mg045_1263 [Bellilinea sp.]
MVAQDEVNRADIFLTTIAGQIEALRQGLFDLSDEVGFYDIATEWVEVMSMVDTLKESRDSLTPEQREQFDDLLSELEKVKPIVEKLKLI